MKSLPNLRRYNYLSSDIYFHRQKYNVPAEFFDRKKVKKGPVYTLNVEQKILYDEGYIFELIRKTSFP